MAFGFQNVEGILSLSLSPFTPHPHFFFSRVRARLKLMVGVAGKGAEGHTRKGDGGEDAVAWTASELSILRQTIRDNGLDDWRTVGDWSQVICHFVCLYEVPCDTKGGQENDRFVYRGLVGT